MLADNSNDGELLTESGVSEFSRTDPIKKYFLSFNTKCDRKCKRNYGFQPGTLRPRYKHHLGDITSEIVMKQIQYRVQVIRFYDALIIIKILLLFQILAY